MEVPLVPLCLRTKKAVLSSRVEGTRSSLSDPLLFEFGVSLGTPLDAGSARTRHEYHVGQFMAQAESSAISHRSWYVRPIMV